MKMAKRCLAYCSTAQVSRLFGTVATVAFFLVLALGSTDSQPTQGGAVKWSKYAPEVRTRINKLISEKDCRGLQREFDIASDNDDATRNRTGEGNSDLMNYIDSSMGAAGCYK